MRKHMKLKNHINIVRSNEEVLHSIMEDVKQFLSVMDDDLSKDERFRLLYNLLNYNEYMKNEEDIKLFGMRMKIDISLLIDKLIELKGKSDDQAV